MENIIIRKASTDEVALLQHIGRRTFVESFAADNTEENMARYLAESFSVEKLSAELSDENSLFFFALLGQEAIGYMKLNFGAAQTELQDGTALEIERIYVLREYHGKKVGQMLYEQAIQVAQQARAAYVWLGVWEKNPKAIRFYQKNGFVPFGTHIFRLGDDEQTDIMMRLPLGDG